MSPWQYAAVAMVVLMDQLLARVSAVAAWFRENLDWSKRKSTNLALLIAVVAGLAFYFWPTQATAQASQPSPPMGEVEPLGVMCTGDGGVRVIADATKVGIIGIEIPVSVIKSCAPGTRI